MSSLAFNKLQADLTAGRPVVMDGSFGELVAARGGKTSLPLWATHALLTRPGQQIVGGVHRDYINAGAQVIETGTFRAQASTFAEQQRSGEPVRFAGVRDPAMLSGLSIRMAGRLAVVEKHLSAKPLVAIAGSMGPIKDCYKPEDTPDNKTLAAEHTRYAASLKDAGVDYVSIETIPTVREAVEAAKAAERVGIPYSVSFWGKNGGIGQEETLAEGVRALDAANLNPLYVGVNCVALEVATSAVTELRRNTDLPIAVSANGDGDPEHHGTWRYDTGHNDPYSQAAEQWLDAGAQLVGGCCGTTPETIQHLSELVGQQIGREAV
jgi:homocysteine S-methyltransferase